MIINKWISFSTYRVHNIAHPKVNWQISQKFILRFISLIGHTSSFIRVVIWNYSIYPFLTTEERWIIYGGEIIQSSKPLLKSSFLITFCFFCTSLFYPAAISAIISCYGKINATFLLHLSCDFFSRIFSYLYSWS